jgi:hypothetical protein
VIFLILFFNTKKIEPKKMQKEDIPPPPPPSSYEFKKYVCSKETLRQTIDQYGVAIIPDVLNEEECQNMVSEIWDFFEHITQSWDIPLKRDNPNTWKEFYKLLPLHSMLIQYWGVGHAQASWNLRQNSKIVEIFAHFWNVTKEELLVSFDGLSFHLPHEVTKRGWNRGNTWYHTDQSFTKPNFECIQSFITGLEIHENDATLSFYEGSNNYHSEFRDAYQIKDKDDWFKLTKEQSEFYTLKKGCEIRNIKCPKGCLVVWDSRTIHCGIEASKERTVPNTRAVVYICYMPRVLCDEKNLKKKTDAFNSLRTTTHYPCKIKLFGKTPRTYGNKLPTITPIQPPRLSSLGRLVAGLDDNNKHNKQQKDNQ